MGKSITELATESFDVKKYREILLQKLEELSSDYKKSKDTEAGILLNMERVGLVFALDLTYDERVNKENEVQQT